MRRPGPQVVVVVPDGEPPRFAPWWPDFRHPSPVTWEKLPDLLAELRRWRRLDPSLGPAEITPAARQLWAKLSRL